jgi:hypothetical protein
MTVWYALLIVGVEVHTHYCGGELEHVAINSSCNEETNSCEDEGCCGHDGCCSINDLYLVLDEDHKLPTEVTGFAITNQVLPVIAQPEPIIERTPAPELFHTDSGPPLFLLNCSFTFYG